MTNQFNQPKVNQSFPIQNQPTPIHNKQQSKPAQNLKYLSSPAQLIQKHRPPTSTRTPLFKQINNRPIWMKKTNFIITNLRF